VDGPVGPNLMLPLNVRTKTHRVFVRPLPLNVRTKTHRVFVRLKPLL